MSALWYLSAIWTIELARKTTTAETITGSHRLPNGIAAPPSAERRRERRPVGGNPTARSGIPEHISRRRLEALARERAPGPRPGQFGVPRRSSHAATERLH